MIESLDYNVGRIMNELDHLDLAQNTLVIFTSDNPRSENPDAIITDMEKGIPTKDKQKVMIISDRKSTTRLW